RSIRRQDDAGELVRGAHARRRSAAVAVRDRDHPRRYHRVRVFLGRVPDRRANSGAPQLSRQGEYVLPARMRDRGADSAQRLLADALLLSALYRGRIHGAVRRTLYVPGARDSLQSGAPDVRVTRRLLLNLLTGGYFHDPLPEPSARRHVRLRL